MMNTNHVLWTVIYLTFTLCVAMAVAIAGLLFWAITVTHAWTIPVALAYIFLISVWGFVLFLAVRYILK